MNTAGQRDPSESCGPTRRHPCESLVFAIREIARSAGYSIDCDSLSVALGLPWLTCAVSTEPDLGKWPMYARDAFIIEAGRLFGMTIRGIHPPEAARGLASATEYRQHFEASYRPLVQRALEHDQPVLAWRGWAGDLEPQWGITQAVCDTGIGFTGTTMSTEDADTAADFVALDGPPIQLYVVETITSQTPSDEELAQVAIERVRIALSGELDERLGVLMGPAAYDAWIKRLGEDTTVPAGASGVASGHRRLATSILAGHRTAMRFLNRCTTPSFATVRQPIDALLAYSGAIVAALDTPASDDISAAPTSTVETDDWSTRLVHAREATSAIAALQVSARR